MTATTMSVLGRLMRLPLLLLTAHLAPFQFAAAQDGPTGNVVASDTAVGRALEAPVNTRPIVQKFWWSDAWYDDGQLPRAENHRVVSSEITYNNPEDDTEIPATLFRPEGDGKFPAVLFQHGRRGLDDLVRRLPLRLAARGFVVLAPDVYAARFIDPFPIEHREETEHDVSAGIDALLALPSVSTTKICLSSHTRGGYYTLKVATSLKRQDSQVACYVSTYPHWQNPNAGEPMQVYRYAPEIDKLVFLHSFLSGSTSNTSAGDRSKARFLR